MPRRNVYLPADLDQKVSDENWSLSAILQEALRAKIKKAESSKAKAGESKPSPSKKAPSKRPAKKTAAPA
jgi:post-segregation antitoxin (ccd killing protein)